MIKGAEAEPAKLPFVISPEKILSSNKKGINPYYKTSCYFKDSNVLPVKLHPCEHNVVHRIQKGCKCEWQRKIVEKEVSVKVNFICQLDWAKGCSESW